MLKKLLILLIANPLLLVGFLYLEHQYQLQKRDGIIGGYQISIWEKYTCQDDEVSDGWMGINGQYYQCITRWGFVKVITPIDDPEP